VSIMSTPVPHQYHTLYCITPCRYAISGDNSGTVLLWDIDNGSAALRLQVGDASLHWCCLSRDARLQHVVCQVTSWCISTNV
jgi:hypothetical protein